MTCLDMRLLAGSDNAHTPNDAEDRVANCVKLQKKPDIEEKKKHDRRTTPQARSELRN